MNMFDGIDLKRLSCIAGGLLLHLDTKYLTSEYPWDGLQDPGVEHDLQDGSWMICLSCSDGKSLTRLYSHLKHLELYT